MTALSQDMVAELERIIAELEQRLESSFAAHDEAIARQAATAEENARLKAELATARDRQSASAGILTTIASAPGDAERSLYQIAETSVHLFGASSATILIAEGDGWDRIIRVGEGSKSIGAAVPETQLRIGGRNMPGTIVAENRQIHVPDLDHVDASIADWPGPPLARAAGTRSMSGSPLRREGNAIGALIVYRDRLAPFTEEEMALQQSFADQAAIAIENARLFDELQARTADLSESLQQQTATADVLKVISRSAFDLQTVLDTLVESAARLCDADRACVFQKSGEVFRWVSNYGFSDELIAYADAHPFTAGPNSTTSRVALEGKTIHNPDVLADPDYKASEYQRLGNYRTMLGIPLLREGTPVGVFILAREQVRPFTDRQIELVTGFADQAVIAIENVRLFDEVQAKTRDLSESLQQQTATADVLKVISRSTFDLQTVLETLIKSAVELSGANRGSIFLREGDAFPLKAASSTTPEFLQYWAANPPRAGRGSATSRVIASGKIEIIPDVLEDPEMEMTAGSLVRIRAALGVPMLRDNKVEGVLVLTRPEPGPFTKSQIDLVQTFADQAVIAVENVRLFDETQARTRELAASLDELRTAQDRLVQTEKLASLGQLTAGIAHEIKNPLNFVNNFSALSAELIDELNEALAPATLDGGTRQEVDELTQLLKANLEKVVQHGKRADSIVKNMLLHSREGAGEHRPTDINALLDESLNLAYHGARAEKPQFNVTLQRSFDETAGTVELFPQEITRVFLNLIANGFYAVSKRGAEPGHSGFEPILRATTSNLGDAVEIRIRDNGTGIPDAVKQKMFNPFFTTKPAGEGTGLGLSMSHDIIVKQHGGSIDVETEPGRFTEFIVVLPRTSHLQDNKRGRT